MKLYWFIIMCVHYVAVTIISFQTISHVQISWISPLLTIHVNILFLFCSSSKFVILDETTQVNETISLLLFINANYWSHLELIFYLLVLSLFCFVLFFSLYICCFCLECFSLLDDWVFVFCFRFMRTLWLCCVCVCVCVFISFRNILQYEVLFQLKFHCLSLCCLSLCNGWSMWRLLRF